MRKVWVWAFAAAALWMPSGVRAQGKSAGAPGCESKSAKQCVELALDAMGGRE